MPSYLLLEDGGKITLEDASGFILLEVQDPAPSELVPGAGKGSKRRYLITRDGERREIDSQYDLEVAVRDIIARNAEPEPQKKKKRSKKIRERAKPGTLLQNFASWDTLEAELASLGMQILQERVLLDLMLAILAREAIREDDEEMLMILEMMT